MPATITHAFFAKDVYEVLPYNIKEKLELSRCRMFGQNTDSLMFYNLFSIKPGKKIRSYQDIVHSTKTQDFFINLLNEIKNSEAPDKDTYSFLMGFICHYILDSTIHPYIIYKTGIMEKGKPNTYKYNNRHAFMESFIDMDMVARRTKKNPYQFDLGAFCFNLKPFSNNLNHVIENTFYETFHLKKMDKIYYQSLKQMKSALLTYRKDPYGIKKFIYKTVDTFTPKSAFRFEAVSYHCSLKDTHNYLNTNHELWRNPIIYNKTSNESFVDLYIKAIKKAKVVICASFDYLDNKEMDLTQIFPNTSYITGLNCNIHKELKYFEF